MKIAIDFKRGASQFKAGIAWYTYNLVHNLAKIDNENSYILYDFKSHNFRQEIDKFRMYLPEHKNFQTKVRRIHSGIARKCCEKFLPIELFIGRSDIVHTPCPPVLQTFKAQTIVTIHDLIYLIPESEKWLPAENRRKGKKEITAAILKSDRIITVSQHAKNDIIKYYSVSPSKISVVYLAANYVFRPSEDREKEKSALRKYGISKKYLFFTGTIYPRKNLVRLIQSFERIKKRFTDYQLVIAGIERTNLNKEFFEVLSKLPAGIRDDIILAGYVPLENLPSLYSRASIYMYPSLYEGFGLPILEAMACGCPVITSNVSSMPEVADDAAVLVDPYSVEEISTAIEKVLSDEQLQARMREKGLARAGRFSWEKTARETLQVYKDVYEQK